MTKKNRRLANMLRPLALASIALCLTACASAPTSETEALAHRVYQGGSQAQNCPVAEYCVTTGTRISTYKMNCSCNRPASLIDVRLGR
jgi:hypothetical protein